MVPSFSEDITRAMCGQPKQPSRNYLGNAGTSLYMFSALSAIFLFGRAFVCFVLVWLFIIWPFRLFLFRCFTYSVLARDYQGKTANLPYRSSNLRWLKTVSSTFQDVDFDGSLLPLLISRCYNLGIRKLPHY